MEISSLLSPSRCNYLQTPPRAPLYSVSRLLFGRAGIWYLGIDLLSESEEASPSPSGSLLDRQAGSLHRVPGLGVCEFTLPHTDCWGFCRRTYSRVAGPLIHSPYSSGKAAQDLGCSVS